jgi:hypothetical protein
LADTAESAPRSQRMATRASCSRAKASAGPCTRLRPNKLKEPLIGGCVQCRGSRHGDTERALTTSSAEADQHLTFFSFLARFTDIGAIANVRFAPEASLVGQRRSEATRPKRRSGVTPCRQSVAAHSDRGCYSSPPTNRQQVFPLSRLDCDSKQRWQTRGSICPTLNQVGRARWCTRKLPPAPPPSLL